MKDYDTICVNVFSIFIKSKDSTSMYISNLIILTRH